MADRFSKVEAQPELPREQPQQTPDQGERLVSPDFGAEQEISPEQAPERGEGEVGQEIQEGATPSVAAEPKKEFTPRVKSPEEEKIEDIMEEGLGDIYARMTEDKQQEFKEVGEETASKINKLLGEAKIKVKEIVELLAKWLKIIPGVSKYFLDQEAKLKADKIMDINEEQGPQNTQDQNKI